MNEIPFASVLRQELRATSTAGPTGEADAQKETEFDKEFSRWVVRYSLGHEASAHVLLEASDLIDAEGFLKLLRNPLEGNVIVKALRDRLAAVDSKESCLQEKPKKLVEKLRHAARVVVGQE